MVELTKEYIFNYLAKIAFDLKNAGYLNVLTKRVSPFFKKIRENLLNLPVEWDEDFFEINGQQIDTHRDLQEEHTSEFLSGKKIPRNMKLKGKYPKDADIDKDNVTLEIQWSKTEEGVIKHNDFYVNLNVNDVDLHHLRRFTDVKRIFDKLDAKVEAPLKSRHDLIDFRKKFTSNKTEHLNHISQEILADLVPNKLIWDNKSDVRKTLFRFNFLFKNVEEENKDKIKSEIEEETTKKEIQEYFHSLMKAENLDPDDYRFTYSYKDMAKGTGFLISIAPKK